MVNLLETWRHPMTVFTMSWWRGNPTPCSCLSSFLLNKTLCSSSVVVSPKFFLLISQSPRMFYLYLSISCAISWSFPAGLSVLVIQVPMVMLSLPRIFDGAPVAYLTYPSWCTAEGVVLVDPSGDWSDSVWLLHVIHCESRAKYNLTEPIPLQVEDVTVEFIVDPFRRPGPCLRTMKIYIQWCRVDTSYFNHKWYILTGRGGRLPSRTGPKDLPTAQYFSQFQDTTDAPLCHIHLPVCLWTMDPNSRASKKNTSHRNKVLPQDTTHLIHRLSPTWKSVPRSSRQ